MNPVAETLTGWAQANALGRPLEQVFCLSAELGNPMLVGRDGRRVPIEERRSPISDGDDTIGIVLVFRDVTHRRRAEEAEALLKVANDRLAQALRGSGVGIWDFDLCDGKLSDATFYWANSWESLGYEPETQTPSSSFSPWLRVHLEDRERVLKAVGAHLRGETREIDVESRLIHKDGSLRWRLNRGVAVRDAERCGHRYCGGVHRRSPNRIPDGIETADLMLDFRARAYPISVKGRQ